MGVVQTLNPDNPPYASAMTENIPIRGIDKIDRHTNIANRSLALEQHIMEKVLLFFHMILTSLLQQSFCSEIYPGIVSTILCYLVAKHMSIWDALKILFITIVSHDNYSSPYLVCIQIVQMHCIIRMIRDVIGSN